MFNPFRSIVRVSAFLRKEIVEIFRQPRLLLTVVLGPFLILLLFGVGYRGEGRTLRTLFVVAPGDAIENQIRAYAQKLGPQIQFAGIERDLKSATSKLLAHKADLIVEMPPDAYQTIRSNKQAVFHLYHNEIDPYQADYIRVTGELYVDKLNRWLVASTAENKKGDVRAVRVDLRGLIQKTGELKSAIQQNQTEIARQKKQEVIAKVNTMEEHANSSIISLASGKTQQSVRSAIVQLQKMRQQLETSPEVNKGNQDAGQIAQMEKELTALDLQLDQVTQIDPQILLSPFRAQTTEVAKQQPKLQQYFTPSVIILLLQHLAITLASLSIVREFRTGAVELFRVSPLLEGELLLGKYLGYVLVSSFVALVLTALLVTSLKIPMLGSWLEYGAVLFALIVTSLGIGFLVSLISSTDNQAIQFSMILLLLSIFFTGFLLNLDLLWRPVRMISWLLPATYGIRLLQDVMLRGIPVNFVMLAILAGSGIVLFIFSAMLLSRRLAPQ